MPKDETTQESAMALVETKLVPIHTGNAYEEDEWNNHRREAAAPNNPGSPNDNGVT
jgi:hypothetical protein